MTQPYLKRLKIHRYEQFVDVPEIEFSPGTNLILGVNGAGKTRLLRLLHAITANDFEALAGQDFEVEFEMVLPGDLALQARVKNKAVNDSYTLIGNGTPTQAKRAEEGGFSVSAQLHLPGGEVAEYEVGSRTSEVRLSNGAFEREQGAAFFTIPLLRIAPLLKKGGTDADAVVRALFPTVRSVFVREDASEFRDLVDEVRFKIQLPNKGGVALSFTSPGPKSIVELIKVFFFQPIFQVGSGQVGSGADRALRVSQGLSMRQLEPLQPSPWELSARTGEQVEVAQVLGPLRAEDIHLVPRVVKSQSAVLDCQGLELRVKFASGTEVASSELTFGQRRFLSMALLFWMLPGIPVLIDEIDNGLHPKLVEAALKMGEGRQQLFLASHNKLVIDYTNFDGPEDVQKKIHIVQRADDGRQTVLTLDDATAREVYEKISVAIQSPSDVLLAEGLW